MTTTNAQSRIDRILHRQRRSLSRDRLILLGAAALTLMNVFAVLG